MSLSTIINAGMSGLTTAQTQLRVVSDNVANVNTPGYVRKIADQQSLTTQGLGAGVEVSRVRLATDRFLQAAGLTASADAARMGARYELYDQVQSLFGDPGSDSSFFARVDQLFSAFAAAAEDPVSSPRRQEALFMAERLFSEAARISAGVQAVRTDADTRITSAIERANGLLTDIEALNLEISRATVTGADASGAEGQQARLIDELSSFLDIRVTARPVGGVSIRTGDGMLLAGDGAAALSYQRAGEVNAETGFNEIWLTEPRGEKRALLDHLASGELKGLIELRDREAPAAAERLAELTARIADELNRAHNANSAVPAPSAMTGRDTGLDLPTAIGGFTGRTTIAVVNASGVVQRRVDVDFDAGTMSVNGAAFGGFTPGTFLATLNGALGGAATASFADRALSLTAAGSNGIAVADDAAAPAVNTGRGFSHYFGLNDLVRSNRLATFDTGLKTTDAHGFTPGQTVTFRFSGETGSRIRDVPVTVPAGGTMADLLSALNSVATGVGRYGSFALDAQGRMSFTPSTTPPATLSVASDSTSRGVGGPSISELFGIGSGVRSSRADGFSLRTDLKTTPTRLALAKLNLSAAPGASALASGDGRGALALADAGDRAVAFEAAGGSGSASMTLSRYVSDLAGDIGGRAAMALDRKEAAETLSREAASRRASFEGVNLDEELVKLTTYQQAFNASARLIQAAKDLYDVLLGIV